MTAVASQVNDTGCGPGFVLSRVSNWTLRSWPHSAGYDGQGLTTRAFMQRFKDSKVSSVTSAKAASKEP